jgi:hypothetical protein
LFLKSTDGKICEPYIIGADGNPKYGKVPPLHKKILDRMRELADKDAANELSAAAPDLPDSKEVPLPNVEGLIPPESVPEPVSDDDEKTLPEVKTPSSK